MKKIELNEVSINLKKLINNNEEIELKINHEFTNTFIDLTKLSNVELFFLDEKGNELNRMRIQEKSSGPFFLLTQAKVLKVKKIKS
jgi:hypothetical protein